MSLLPVGARGRFLSFVSKASAIHIGRVLADFYARPRDLICKIRLNLGLVESMEQLGATSVNAGMKEIKHHCFVSCVTQC